MKSTQTPSREAGNPNPEIYLFVDSRYKAALAQTHSFSSSSIIPHTIVELLPSRLVPGDVCPGEGVFNVFIYKPIR